MKLVPVICIESRLALEVVISGADGGGSWSLLNLTKRSSVRVMMVNQFIVLTTE